MESNEGRTFYGDIELDRGKRYFADEAGNIVRVVSDVDTMEIMGFATTAIIEAARTEARTHDRTAIRVRLVEILTCPGVVFSRHRRLRKWDGSNRPPFFLWGKRRAEFDSRTPWWISADRRESYLSMVFLEEHGSVDDLVALLRNKEVSSRTLKRFMRKCKLSEVALVRLRKACAIFAGDDTADEDDPVQDLASAVTHPNEWCRPHVSLMLREAAEQGLTGPLAALYPTEMNDRLLAKLWQQGFVPDGLYKALYGTGTPVRELTIGATVGDDALSVDTGELNAMVQAETAKLAVRAG